MANHQMIPFTSSSSSSSSTSVFNPKNHDVFLSFRGEDTRRNFTSHLYDALLRSKVKTYIDNQLEKGDEIGPELIKAIEGSYASVVIFSENYANSKWCLDEISKIMECKKDRGQIVIPVFYNIDPSHVRKQSGSYEKAFAKHEQDLKHNKDKVHKWKTALFEAASLAGWDVSRTDRTEAELIKQIVEDVLTRLEKNYVGKNDSSKVLVGIDEQVAFLVSLAVAAHESDAVRAIGIWGMGGIGKTTLAREIFDKLRLEYEASCFMENVREDLQNYGVDGLQNKLLHALLEKNDSSIGVPNQYNLNRLRLKKILLVLDDVDNLGILISLCGSLDWFGKGSRVIVISRDKQVLINLANDIYEVKALQSKDSLKLFSLHAFKENCPKGEWMDLSLKAVNYTKGVPLAIKVLGSFLYGKEKGVWESQLEKLKKMTLPEIQKVLRLSYNGLDREEQDIFLYLACFFSQNEYRQDVSILDDCGYSMKVGLTKLCDKALISDKALIYFPERDCLNYWTMHALIREMGKEIVCEESRDPGKRRHLWDPQDVYQVLENATGTGAIQSLRLDMGSESRDISLNPKAFNRMFNLKFLKLCTKEKEAKMIAPKDSISLPKGLRYLAWQGCPLKSLDSSFCAENLVEFDISYSNLKRLWNGVQNLVKLKRISLHHCAQLVELPDLSKALNVEYVNLSDCIGLSYLHPSILSLPNLKHLNLYRCEKMISFRSDHQFKYLEYITLKGCTSLKEFSVMSESMVQLSLCDTNIVEANSLGLPLNKLEYWNCGFSKSLPHKFLQQLNLWEFRKFTLDLFDMRYCLKSLDCLNLSNTNIESLPTSINQLSMLKELELSNCKRLRCIPPLPPSIDLLDVDGCVSLEEVSISTLGRCFCNACGYFSFLNCWRLNEKALNTIMSFTHDRINEAGYIQHLQPYDHKNDGDGFVVYLPGRKVPADSYKYWTTTEFTMSIQLSNLSNLIGISFCVIFSSTQYDNHFREFAPFSCSFLTSSGQKEKRATFWLPTVTPPDTDRVLLWYNERFSKSIIEEIKERSIDNQCTTYDLELSLKFHPLSLRYTKMKEWGVHPIYASDLFSFSVPLASVAKTKRKRDTEELLDMDPPPPKKKLKAA